jgi:hypothetical protein
MSKHSRKSSGSSSSHYSIPSSSSSSSSMTSTSSNESAPAPAPAAPSSLDSDIYTGASVIGKVRVTISAVIAGFISVGLLFFGLYYIFSKDKYKGRANALVSNSQCTFANNLYQCMFTASFNVNGKSFEVSVNNSSSLKISDGQSISISYNMDDPNDIKVGDYDPKKMGFILIGVAFAVVLVVGLITYFTYKYKPFAAVEGVTSVIDMARN